MSSIPIDNVLHLYPTAHEAKVAMAQRAATLSNLETILETNLDETDTKLKSDENTTSAKVEPRKRSSNSKTKKAKDSQQKTFHQTVLGGGVTTENDPLHGIIHRQLG
jgi:hypothetical protein